MAVKFPEWFCCKHTCILTAYWGESSSKYSLWAVCTSPNDAATVGNIFGTPVVE